MHYEMHCGSLIKALWHDGLGLSLYARRLDLGRFVWATVDGAAALTERSWSVDGESAQHLTIIRHRILTQDSLEEANID